MTTFELLHPKIQKVIYKMGWINFRIIQDEAIEYLTKNSNDLIISAPTASGKTEACFLPIISNIINDETEGIKILYISPLKALINDQFHRIETMCEELKFPIVKWHGDSNYKDKQDLVKNPNGILLITPESIEALFINKYKKLNRLFKNLKYIVIDEIHSFIQEERGNHLFSLLNRIEEITKCKVTKIALSATLYDCEPIKKWINYDDPKSVKVIKFNEIIASGLIGMINGYDKAEYNEKLLNDLYRDIRCNKNLIFGNSKETLEKISFRIKEIAKKEKILNRFYIHHGSLSKEIREGTETKLKKEKDISVFCSSTLELGIDIGDIDKVIFLDTVFNVSSTIQRLGRSGRKEGKARNFKMFIEELPYSEKLPHKERLRLHIFQSIAIIELLAREKWCEPLKINFSYSTIIHQILSFLGATGGDNIENIYNNIIKIAYRDYISKEQFLDIIKSLRDNKIIYQVPTNNIITLDKNGENLVHNYKFYPAFITTEEYEINFNGNIIGFLDIEKLNLNIGDSIILAGNQWLIINIFPENKMVIVQRTQGGNPIFADIGRYEIHKKIHQKMKELYEERIPNIPYINEKAMSLMQEGYKEYKIFKDKYLLLFAGTKIQATINFLLKNYLKNKDEEVLEDLEIGFYHFKGREFLLQTLKNIDINKKTFYNILKQKDIKKIQTINKFDHLLSKESLIEEYIKNNFDIGGVLEIL